jgi:hypothetical protein
MLINIIKYRQNETEGTLSIFLHKIIYQSRAERGFGILYCLYGGGAGTYICLKSRTLLKIASLK